MRDWNEALFDDETLQRWEAYKKTEDFLGADPTQRATLSRQPMTQRLQAWANKEKLGEQVYDPATESYTYKFVIPKDKVVVLKGRQLLDLRQLIDVEIQQVDANGRPTGQVDHWGVIYDVQEITENQALSLMKQMQARQKILRKKKLEAKLKELEEGENEDQES